jgi:hypothetical protein
MSLWRIDEDLFPRENTRQDDLEARSDLAGILISGQVDLCRDRREILTSLGASRRIQSTRRVTIESTADGARAGHQQEKGKRFEVGSCIQR